MTFKYKEKKKKQGFLKPANCWNHPGPIETNLGLTHGSFKRGRTGNRRREENT
jgi:hypothetical protein